MANKERALKPLLIKPPHIVPYTGALQQNLSSSTALAVRIADQVGQVQPGARDRLHALPSETASRLDRPQLQALAKFIEAHGTDLLQGANTLSEMVTAAADTGPNPTPDQIIASIERGNELRKSFVYAADKGALEVSIFGKRRVLDHKPSRAKVKATGALVSGDDHFRQGYLPVLQTLDELAEDYAAIAVEQIKRMTATGQSAATVQQAFTRYREIALALRARLPALEAQYASHAPAIVGTLARGPMAIIEDPTFAAALESQTKAAKDVANTRVAAAYARLTAVQAGGAVPVLNAATLEQSQIAVLALDMYAMLNIGVYIAWMNYMKGIATVLNAAGLAAGEQLAGFTAYEAQLMMTLSDTEGLLAADRGNTSVKALPLNTT